MVDCSDLEKVFVGPVISLNKTEVKTSQFYVQCTEKIFTPLWYNMGGKMTHLTDFLEIKGIEQ